MPLDLVFDYTPKCSLLVTAVLAHGARDLRSRRVQAPLHVLRDGLCNIGKCAQSRGRIFTDGTVDGGSVGACRLCPFCRALRQVEFQRLGTSEALATTRTPDLGFLATVSSQSLRRVNTLLHTEVVK